MSENEGRPRTGSRIDALREDSTPRSAPSRPPGGAAGRLASAFSRPMRIGLWGGVSSGKTLFTGALEIAANAAGAAVQGHGVRVIAANDEATHHMKEATTALGRKGNLPPATVEATDLRWVFSGKLTYPSASGRRFHLPAWLSRTVRFELDVRDPPGGDYRNVDLTSTRPSAEAQINQSVEALTRADGLIYLFDPIAAAEDNEFPEYFTDTLARLNTVSVADGRQGRYLPQRLAVCVTKFDDDRVFRRAVAAGLVYSDPAGALRVPGNRLAGEFFELICKDTGHTNALHLLESIRNNFSPRSVRYYVTSAVGFSSGSASTASADPILRYRPNVQESVDNQRRVIEQARPINVLEPVLDLVRLVRRDQILRASRARLGEEAPNS